MISLSKALFAITAIAVIAPIGVADVPPQEPVNGPYLGQPEPGDTPVQFAPDLISTEGIQHCFPAFSPDGLELYWTTFDMEGERPRPEIWFMKATDTGWSKPQVAPFSGQYSDHNPVFSHDGSRLYFASRRPGALESKGCLWYLERTDDGWSDPKPLGSPPNTELSATQPTFTTNGNLYFVCSFPNVKWNRTIYRCEKSDSGYTAPIALPPPVRTEDANVYPYIAPDESFLLFGSTRPGGSSTETDLYFSHRNEDGSWEQPIHLDSTINDGFSVSFPFVTHDGKYLFFNRFDSTGSDRFFWVNASILQKYRSTDN